MLNWDRLAEIGKAIYPNYHIVVGFRTGSKARVEVSVHDVFTSDSPLGRDLFCSLATAEGATLLEAYKKAASILVHALSQAIEREERDLANFKNRCAESVTRSVALTNLKESFIHENPSLERTRSQGNAGDNTTSEGTSCD